MSVDKQKALSKIRTFAQDLKEHQPDAGQPAEENLIKPEKGVAFETPKMAAPNTSRHSVTVEDRVPTTPEKNEEEKQSENKLPSKVIIAKPPEPTKNSIFDGLQKKVEEHIQNEPKKSTLPKPKVKVRSSSQKGKHLSTTTASIITDVKPSSEGFFSRVIKSFNNWLTSQKKQKKKAATQYVIEDTLRRKGVIQKATTKTGALFTADNETLREEIIKRRSYQKNHEETKDPEITWTPNTETGYSLLESAPEPETRIKNVQVAFKKKTVPPPTLIEPSDEKWEHATVPEETLNTIDQKPVAKTSFEPIIESPEIINYVPTEQEVPEYTQESRTEPVEKIRRNSILKDILQKRIRFFDVDSNAIAITVAASIVFVVALVLITRSIFILLSAESNTSAVLETTPILTTATVVDIALEENSKNGLIKAVSQSDAAANSNLTEINFVTADKEDIPSQSLIEIFGFSTNTNLNRSISEIRILSIDQTDHGIVFTTTDDTTAFGALLAWEENMAAELTSIIELPPITKKARFIDKTIAGTDVRILQDEDSEVLVYGFVGKGIVVIAPDSSTFTLIANSI